MARDPYGNFYTQQYYDPYSFSTGMFSAAPSMLEEARRASLGASGEIAPELEMLTGDQFSYSPEQLAYLQQVQDYLASQGGTGYTLTPGEGYQFLNVDPRSGAAVPLTADQLAALMSSETPFENRFEALFTPKTNKGNLAGNLRVSPTEQVRLTDKSGNVYFEGTGYEAAARATQLAEQISREEGKKANWNLQTFDPTSGQWETQAKDREADNMLGKIADIALPTIGALVGGPWGAAIGAGLSGVAQGKGIEDIALQAALAGGTTYAGGQLFGGAPISNTVSQTVGQQAGQQVGQELAKQGAQKLAEAAAADLVVTASRNALTNAAIGKTVGALAGSTLGSALSGSGSGGYDGPPIVSTAQRPPVNAPAFGGPAGGAASSFLDFDPTGYQQTPSPTQQQPAQQAPQTQQPTVDDGIVVTGTPKPPVWTAEALAALGITGLGAQALLGQPMTPSTPTDGGKSTSMLDKIKAGGTILGLVDGLLGGGGGSSDGLGGSGVGGAFSSMRGPLPAAFSAPMPAPNNMASNLAPRDVSMSTQDWLRYGMGPEASFFQNVPQRPSGVTGMAHGGYAEGGAPSRAKRSSFAVNGPGTGRSDEIPALLSDGEYVIDAETVALLGDGSSKAGAEKLDAFRVKVRKHKGRNLAKGRFSDKAKGPEKYMGGGLI